MILLNISTNVILLISGAGVLQAVLLAALLYFHQKSDRSVSIFLALHIVCVSIFMLMPIVQQLFSWQVIISLLPFQYLIAPFLYLYVRSFKEVITWRKAWPHFVLFVISALANYYLYATGVYKYPSSSIIPTEVLLHPKSYIQIIIRNLQMLIYFFLAQRSFNQLSKIYQSLIF